MFHCVLIGAYAGGQNLHKVQQFEKQLGKA